MLKSRSKSSCTLCTLRFLAHFCLKIESKAEFGKRSIVLLFYATSSFSDLPVYNLNACKENIEIGSYAGKKLYLCAIRDGDFGIVIIRNASTAMDFAFAIDDNATPIQAFDPEGAKKIIVPTVLQFLYAGVCTPPVNGNINVLENGFSITYQKDCSRYSIPDKSTDVWHWQSSAFQKFSTTSQIPSDEKFTAYKKLLKQGKLLEAIQNVPENDPTGGWSSCHYDVYQELLKFVHQKAKKLMEADDQFTVIALSLWMLENPPVASCLFNDDEASFILSYSNEQKKLGDGTLLPESYPNVMIKQNPENILILNDLAYFIHTIYPRKAEMLLKQIIKADPNRNVAYLNLADTIFLQGEFRKKEYQSYYQKYVELMTNQGLKAKIPSYVFERLE